MMSSALSRRLFSIAAGVPAFSLPTAIQSEIPMLDKPQIPQTEAQHTAIIRLTIPRAEIQSVMGPAIAEVMSAIAAQGITSAGSVFSHPLIPLQNPRF